MRVAILGAGGIIAPAIVRDLAESDEAAELLLLDLDEARAHARWPSAHGGGKSRAARGRRPRAAWRDLRSTASTCW